MRVHIDLKRTVVFIGHHDQSSKGLSFSSIGTGFLVGHRGYSTLVTNKHVAHSLGDDPFSIRFNLTDGGSGVLIVEGTEESRIAWYFHQDHDVDLAVAPLSFDAAGSGSDALHLPTSMLVNQHDVDDNAIGVGDIVHTIGLFRFLDGKSRNIPIVFTGNIAMLPGDERVPVEDWDTIGGVRYVHAYLVEGNGIEGMSGSPVFVRPPKVVQFITPKPDGTKIETVQVINSDIKLLGVWSNSFSQIAHRILANGTGSRAMIPVGVGVVVPSPKLLEILDGPQLKEKFDMLDKKRELSNAAKLTSVVSGVTVLPATGANPTHREDFNRLLDVAAKTPPQDDQT